VARLCLVLLLGGVAWRAPVSAQESPPSEYALKAAFISKFVNFVTWPSNSLGAANEPLVLTVLGTDPFGATLEETMQNTTVHGRRIVVQRVRDEGNLATCHVLFVSASEEPRLPEILGRLRGQPLLTISETDQFCQQGGMINFIRTGRHVRFEINPQAAERAGLKISSQLLKLATIVKDSGKEGSP
jgi:hypothetical protein